MFYQSKEPFFVSFDDNYSKQASRKKIQKTRKKAGEENILR